MMAKFTISLYRQGKTWLFDDASKEIKAEPFVCGASEMIQKYLDRGGNKAISNVLVEFSTEPIENADIVLTCIEKYKPMKLVETEERFGDHTSTHLTNLGFKFVEDENAEPTSADYLDEEGDECWLCPAQLKFFGKVADTIYAKFV